MLPSVMLPTCAIFRGSAARNSIEAAEKERCLDDDAESIVCGIKTLAGTERRAERARAWGSRVGIDL